MAVLVGMEREKGREKGRERGMFLLSCENSQLTQHSEYTQSTRQGLCAGTSLECDSQLVHLGELLHLSVTGTRMAHRKRNTPLC